MILPDANIWIYAFDKAFDHAHERARSWLDEWVEQADLLVPSLVETEVIHYLSRQLPPEAAGDAVSGFLAHPGEFVLLGPGVNRQAAKLLLSNRDRGIGGRDAAILVHAKHAGATVITHDQAVFSVAIDMGLDAHDPILEAPA